MFLTEAMFHLFSTEVADCCQKEKVRYCANHDMQSRLEFEHICVLKLTRASALHSIVHTYHLLSITYGMSQK